MNKNEKYKLFIPPLLLLDNVILKNLIIWEHALETWLSGWRHRFRKPASGKPDRGFKSLRFRRKKLAFFDFFGIMVRTNHTVVGYQRLRLMSRGVNGFWNSHCTQPKMSPRQRLRLMSRGVNGFWNSHCTQPKMSPRHFWSHRLTVRTSGFHPGNPGSIPGGITNLNFTLRERISATK